ncbi:MAG: DNA polymerase Y family protein [Steroidobacteraceae bacterium]
MNIPAQAELDLLPAAVGSHSGKKVGLVAAKPAAAQPAAELWLAVQVGEAVIADDAQRAGLLRSAGRFTPRMALEPPDALLLELAGSQRLFGGLRPLLSALRTAFPAPLPLAMAPTPLAALVLARAGCNGCITSPVRLHSRLAPLPLATLRWPEEVLERLHDMGVTCVGDLLRLPRAGLARRIGPEHLRQLDCLVGLSADPRVALAPAERFFERIDPDGETLDRDRLLAALAPSFGRLEDFLRARQRGIIALRVMLVHRAGPPTICMLRCVVAEYRAARFTALLAARLESLRLDQPVRRLQLTAGRLRRFAAASGGLWQPGEQGGALQAQLPEFLQTLLARLGEGAVYGLAAVAEHRPERQWRGVVPWLPQHAEAAPMTGGPARPLGLLPQPLALAVEQDAAGSVRGLWYEGAALQLVSGPERIESGWWDGGDIRRDYYIARTDQGALLWVFRERGEPGRWFLHGCFA